MAISHIRIAVPAIYSGCHVSAAISCALFCASQSAICSRLPYRPETFARTAIYITITVVIIKKPCTTATLPIDLMPPVTV